MCLFPKTSVCKHLFALLIAVLLCLMGGQALATDTLQMVWDMSEAGTEPQVQAVAAALIDGKSGRILWQQNGDAPLPPASTAKILTALTALGLVDLAEMFEVSQQAAAVGDASINLRAGETLSFGDLLQGALVRSGNDACYAIGENVAGTEPLFVHWLNLKALQIGAYSTNFTNTNGLPSPAGHQISAVDLALVTRYAMANEFFAETVASKYIEIGEGASYRRLQNTNKLLWQDDEVSGVKTGTTDAAGPCLVASLDVEGADLISVVFHSPDRYGECLRLLRYGEAHYRFTELLAGQELAAYIPVTGGAQEGVLLAAAAAGWCAYTEEELTGLRLDWRLPRQLSAPVEKGQYVGRLVVTNAAGEELANISLVAADHVDVAPKQSLWQRIRNRFR